MGLSPQLSITRPGAFRYLLDRTLPSLHRFLTNAGSLSKPPEADALDTYLRDIRAKIENDIRHKTYIPLAGKEVPSSALSDNVREDPYIQPMQRMIRQIMGREQGGDSASAQIAAVNRRSRVVRDIIKTLLKSRDPLILLGDPGTGKTMTLQQAVLVLVDSEIERVFPIITLYVRLGEFYVEGKKVTPDDVLNYVKRSVSPLINQYIDQLDAARRLIILFDGMDEMSRERYGEHTEALSIFAGSRNGRTKTLFSCRITDFSPKFMHRRLVLLPFSHEQIALYLRKYIPRFPLVIDGEEWTLKRLVRRISRGDLPMEATNPFVLWLLCFQLQQKGSWPSSRVELLGFYIEENFRRKTQDLQADDSQLPAKNEVFRQWGNFAFAITTANRGATIEERLLGNGDADDAHEVADFIRLGKLCGVLTESVEERERLVRFEHHRFQEYFTAFHIYEAKEEISWLDKLDAPRWQETMLNLVLMGGGEDALRTLARSISVDDDNSEIKSRETIIADRVELASRVVRQTGAGFPSVKEALVSPLKKAINFLSKEGNPITQVKMMRACQNVPQIDLIEVLQNSLDSPINWVRNQALIIVSSSNRSPQVIGSHFATELGLDLANGLFPLRLKGYAKAAAASGRVRNWWCLALASFSYLVNVSLLLSVAALLYFLLIMVADKALWPIPLTTSGYITACSALTIGAIGISLKYDPGKLWAGILGTAAGSLALLAIVMSAWNGLGNFVGTIIGVFFLGAFLATLIGVPLALAFHYFALSIYLVGSSTVRQSGHPARLFYAATWRNAGFRELLKEGLKAVGSLILYNLIWLVPILLYKTGSWLSSASHLPFSMTVNLLIIVSLVAVIAALVVVLVKRDWHSAPKALKYVFLGAGALVLAPLLIVAVNIALGWVFGALGWIFTTLDRKMGSLGAYLGWILGILLILGIVAGLIYAFWILFRGLRVIMPWNKMAAAPSSITPEKWRAELINASPEQQHLLLIQTNHQTLGVHAEEFLNLLGQVQAFIKMEPALSTYWDKRDQLEQVIRQERQG